MTSVQVFPIFPLESVLLVPGTLLPLHIFEPRYREMVRDALEGHGLIGMAMPREGHATSDESAPPVHPVVHVGRIVRHEPYEDGRMDVVIEGLARMRIDQELPPERPYRVVHALPLPDVDTGDPDALRAAFEELVQRFPDLTPEQLDELRALPAARAADVLLLRLPLSARDKHRIHADPDPRVRMDTIHRILDVLTGRSYSLDVRRGDPRLN
jgi:Lon protease-like protein